MFSGIAWVRLSTRLSINYSPGGMMGGIVSSLMSQFPKG